MRYYSDVGQAIDSEKHRLITLGYPVDTGHWQGVPTAGKPDLVTREIDDCCWRAPMPQTEEYLVGQAKPSMHWAEDHFQERVSGVPSNPGEEYKNWPWWGGQDAQTMGDGRFTHTYQERFWPKWAGEPRPGRGVPGYKDGRLVGIRYPYGDLNDLIELLYRHPFTRQAYIPIFFPEDTGAVHGGRIPCTLGYHFMLRQMPEGNPKLHLWYTIRSCDLIQHFRNDVYLTVRLAQWVINELTERDMKVDVEAHPEHDNVWSVAELGNLTFECHSLHYFEGQKHLVYDA